MEFNQKQINIFKELGVVAIYIFGSQAQGLAQPMSDVDIGIIFDKPAQYKNKTMDAYAEFYSIFTDIFPGKDVDIVFLQLVSPALQFRAVRDGQIIYEADQEQQLTYRENVFKNRADFEYFYDIQYNAALQRI